jgi:hypothetical protein
LFFEKEHVERAVEAWARLQMHFKLLVNITELKNSSHIREHFTAGARPDSELFPSGVSPQDIIDEAFQLIQDPNNIISSGLSKKGASEVVLDFGRAINITNTTSKVRIWVENGYLRTIHPLK